MTEYRRINRDVMQDTKHQYETIPVLVEAVHNSISKQYVVFHEENIDQPVVDCSETKYIVSGKRSFEAAKAYKGKKIAVLNFANNHAIGGAPYSAGAQEESLCRCSTLLPCLEAMKNMFYDYHIRLYSEHKIGDIGNDDLIYTPDVVVFKTDERTDPIYPKQMPQEDWYDVNVITSAAPQVMNLRGLPRNYEEIITSRIKKILDVAWKEGNEVLILGAWGCGAFGNPSEVVSKVFYKLLSTYNFEIVEFALATRGDVSGSVFANNPNSANHTVSEPNACGDQRITPEHITSLKENEVFVFGSNLQGQHAGGAAKLAHQKFGAVWGLGVGLAGQSYAIPTMQGGVSAIKPFVDQFIEVAKIMDSKFFYVTKIGCGTAGFTKEEIAPLFREALELKNVALPQDFVEYLRMH